MPLTAVMASLTGVDTLNVYHLFTLDNYVAGIITIVTYCVIHRNTFKLVSYVYLTSCYISYYGCQTAISRAMGISSHYTILTSIQLIWHILVQE